MRAVLKNGLIHPQEAVPEDWSEGTEVEVRKRKTRRSKPSQDRADEWIDAVEASAAQGNPD